MKLLTHIYDSLEELEKFLLSLHVKNPHKVFLQIFSSNTSLEQSLHVRDFVLSKLPDIHILGTSTSGIVNEGEILDNQIILSFSIFEDSFIQDVSYDCESTQEVIADLKRDKITLKTKLLIIFADTFRFDVSELLQNLAKEFPHIVIAGGNAGDDFRFEQCYVFNTSSKDSTLAIAIIDSEVLQIKTDYLFNWESIGRSMVVTKSEGSKVYELDNENIIDVYAKYLGKYVAQNLMSEGIEFPLVFTQNAIDTARAVIAYDMNEKSMTFAGNIPQGCEVRFGFANIEYIEEENQEQLIKKHTYRNEAVYLYTCSARRQMLGNFLTKEMKIVDKIGASTGFVTYGEFFHDTLTCTNNFLNITSTFLCLNERQSFQTKISLGIDDMRLSKDEIRLRALTNLLKKTSQELDDNLYYLEQFKDTINSAYILSITNAKGKITYANENFQRISGYKKEDLIGKSHNIVRHEEMHPNVFRDLWENLKSGKMWKGLIKNRRKNGSSYYVLSQIAPIYKKDGTLQEYIGLRTDVTELEEYKDFLQKQLNVSKTNLKQSVNYVKQFEEAINLATAVIKTDTQNIITFVNDKFISLSGYTENELIGIDCKLLRDKKHIFDSSCEKILQELKQNREVFQTMSNIAKNGEVFYTNTLFYPIKNTLGDIIEFVQIMFDVTDIKKLNEEIIQTQKEVVEKMGAIGETRSKETGDHVKRVAEYSYLLALLYGLPLKDALLLKQASPMHDIGKVGIPDSILNKPGKLSTEEFEVMKTHAQIGYEMLKSSQRDILKASATVAHTHHEKWDGSGYPLGLKGEEIHIYGRITAVADVFDALGHDRVYKKAWELDAILEYFKEQRGKHFDPRLVDLFFDNLEKFLEIQKEYSRP